MLDIIFFSIISIVLLFILGFGVSKFILPKKLYQDSLWLTPWISIILIIISLAFFSLVGINVKGASPILFAVLLLATLYCFISKKLRSIKITKKDALITLIIMVSIFINIYPLLNNQGIMTSISLGNTDISNYAFSSDYLIKYPLFDNQVTNLIQIQNMFHKIYRWGPSLLTSFFLNLYKLEGYQFVYIMQVLLYALMLPLIAMFYKTLFGQNKLGELMCMIFAILNVNLLYLVYHGFFGHVLYFGISLLIFIFLFRYFDSKASQEAKISKYDILLGLAITVLFFSYHEASVFITIPLAIYFVVKIMIRFKARQKLKTVIYPILKIAGIPLLIFPYVLLASNWNLFNRFMLREGQARLGWPPFRTIKPFPNPFEILGFHNIHSSGPLPTLVVIFLSLLIIIIIALGIKKSKNIVLLLCIISFSAFIYFWYLIINPNYFAYFKAISYTLPLTIILFIRGLMVLLSRVKLLIIPIGVVLFILLINSVMKLNVRFKQSYLSVNPALVSLKQAKNYLSSTKLSYYHIDFINNSPVLWNRLWSDYFLYPNLPTYTVPTSQQTKQYENAIPNDSLILAYKSSQWFQSSKIVFNDILWNNEYFQLGKICNSDECLINHPLDLSYINIGKSNFDNSLLLSGWGEDEPDARWANSTKSSLRLVSKNNSYKSLLIEARTLQEPQIISVYFNNKLIGKKSVKTEWAEYEFPLPTGTRAGVHNIVFSYSQLYQPSIVLNNQDFRTLALSFRLIKLQ